MSSIRGLQQYLKDTGRYTGVVDDLWGPQTQAALVKLFEDGPDTRLTEQDFIDSAARLGVSPAHIKAVVAVESSGAGFFEGYPVILPEPHWFSRLTKGIYDRIAPDVSYPQWGTHPYPKTQKERYSRLIKMIKLSPMDGFASASYGKFQILGANFKEAGYPTPMHFAEAMAMDEKAQLIAFERFVVNKGLLKYLRTNNWAAFARGYNGPAYRKNQYDAKLLAAFRKFS